MDNEIRAFLNSAIPSVWTVEVLLLLKRETGRTWTIAELTRELRSHDRLVAEVLVTLRKLGFVVERDNGYAYAPAGQALDDLARRIEQTYRRSPVSVLNAIHDARTQGLHQFADAFRFRKDRKP